MRKKIKRKRFILGLITLILIFLFNFYSEQINALLTSFNNWFKEENSYSEKNNEENINTIINSDLKIYFIDVGQADSILIQSDKENMLIDAGNNEDGEKLVTYLKKLGVDKFKYVVGTHPHEDHIGGLDDIINSFDIETLYLPDAITTTKTFEDVLDALENKNMSFEIPKIDSSFSLGDAYFKILYTGTDIKDLNNTSIVLKMSFGQNSFLFMGDATSEVEEKILSKDLEADLLKVGHHGSRYSSSDQFLDAVNCKYAIISCGKDNSYNHPHNETLKKLEERKVVVHRTDLEGTIVVTSDGMNIDIENIKTDTNG